MNTLPALAKIMGIPERNLGSIAKILTGSDNPETPEAVAMLVAFTHLQGYTSPDIAMGLLVDYKGLKIVAVVNRSVLLIDEVLIDIQSGEIISPESIDKIFENHTVDAQWVAESILEHINASASPAAPPQPPSAAGADPQETAADTP
jgi:hypothetical protein